MKREYINTPANLTRLTAEIKAAIGLDFKYVESIDSTINVYIEDTISQANLDALDTVISAHVAVAVSDVAAMKINEAIIFGNSILSKMASENVAMGVTQAGKSGDVLAVFTERVSVPSSTRSISAMEAIQSGTLYVLIEIIDFHISNMAAYSDLSPFITTQRLEDFKESIAQFLA